MQFLIYNLLILYNKWSNNSTTSKIFKKKLTLKQQLKQMSTFSNNSETLNNTHTSSITNSPISTSLTKRKPHYTTDTELLKEQNAYAIDQMFKNKQLKKQRKHDIQKLYHDGANPKYTNFKLQKVDNTTIKIREKKKCTFVFDPNGRFSYWMSFTISLAFLYNFWVIIYRYAFNEINSYNKIYWLVLDYTADFLYICDIAFNFRTGFLDEGVLQTDPFRIKHYYMNTTRFYIDCLCLLPLDILYLSIGYNSILRCFRLVKVYRFWTFLDRTERHTNYPNMFRSVVMLHYLFSIFHWNACFCYIIAQYLGDGANKSGTFTNMINQQINSKSSDDKSSTLSFFYNDDQRFKFKFKADSTSELDITIEYLKAFYWSTMIMTLIGDLPRPNTKAEYFFISVELIFALLLFATIMGQVAYIVANLGNARKEFQSKLDAVKTYMLIRRVPIHLQDRVIRWFDFLWTNHKSTDDNQILSLLPYKLRGEIAIHVHLDTLKRVEIFQNTEAGFLNELVLRLKPVLYSPGDFICRKGEVGKEMYIVNRGKLHVISDNGKSVLATLKAGSYFGEISVLNMGASGNRRTASVKSVGYSDLFCLSKEDLWEVLKEYPAVRVKLEAIAVKRLEKHKKSLYEEVNLMRSKSTPGLIEQCYYIPKHEVAYLKRHSTLPNTYFLTNKNKNLNNKMMINVNNPNLIVDGMKLPDKNTLNSESHNLQNPNLVVSNVNELDNQSINKKQQDSNSIIDDIDTASEYKDGSIMMMNNKLRYLKTAKYIPDMNSKNPDSKLILIQEIQRLRSRLLTVETENTLLKLTLQKQHSDLNNRLNDIEMQINTNRESSDIDSDLTISDDCHV